MCFIRCRWRLHARPAVPLAQVAAALVARARGVRTHPPHAVRARECLVDRIRAEEVPSTVARVQVLAALLVVEAEEPDKLSLVQPASVERRCAPSALLSAQMARAALFTWRTTTKVSSPTFPESRKLEKVAVAEDHLRSHHGAWRYRAHRGGGGGVRRAMRPRPRGAPLSTSRWPPVNSSLPRRPPLRSRSVDAPRHGGGRRATSAVPASASCDAAVKPFSSSSMP